jgi:hypothetical protein
MSGKNNGSRVQNHLRMELPAASNLRLIKMAATKLPPYQQKEVEAAIFRGEPPSLSTRLDLQRELKSILNV